MQILDGVLAYRLLNTVNLTNEQKRLVITNKQKQLVKATVSKMDYQIMKDQLKMVYSSTSTNVDNKIEVDKTDVKPEESEVFYT